MLENETKKLLDIYDFAKNRWAVVGFNYNRAKQIIDDIEKSYEVDVLRRVRTKHEIRTEFTDDTLLKWVNASSFSSRGQKFGKMWCDKNIDKDILKRIIMPMYFGKREDIIWL